MLYTSLLQNTTTIHCTPLPLHPPVMNTQRSLTSTSKCDLREPRGLAKVLCGVLFQRWTYYYAEAGININLERGGILMSTGNYLESLSQQILVGIILVARLRVRPRLPRKRSSRARRTASGTTGSDARRAALLVRDFKDTVCPFFESDTLFLECCFVLCVSRLAIHRIKGCLKSTL